MKSKLQITWLLGYLSASVSAAIITPTLPDIELQFGLRQHLSLPMIYYGVVE